ncbi:hypothetical protein AN642_02870 [Epulopiscium sp. SCG-B10WGA-EpuloA2]|nr:hypothetical protein AN642_02870 [Epulopiscium sp. SCG-B10WGA-EpuloA2]
MKTTKKVNTIGIIGSNLTSLMLCKEAKKRGIETILLDEENFNISSDYATYSLVGEFNKQNLERLALRCDVLVCMTNLITNIKHKVNENTIIYPNLDAYLYLISRKNQLILADSLKIDVPKTFVITTVSGLDNSEIKFPLKCYMYIQNKTTNDTDIDIFEIEDKKGLLELKRPLRQKNALIILEKIEQYEQILSITTVVDKKKNIISYPICEEKEEDNTGKTLINIPPNITKTLNNKIEKTAKKMTKELKSPGIFTMKFGINNDKKLIFLALTPGVSVGDIYTNHICELSVYEQFLNIIENKPAINTSFDKKAIVYISNEEDGQNMFDLPYHIYKIGLENKQNIEIIVSIENNL